MGIDYDLGRISNNFQNDVSGIAKSTLIGGAVVTAGAIGLGVAAAKNRRLRLKLAGILHFLVAFPLATLLLLMPFLAWVLSSPQWRTQDSQALDGGIGLLITFVALVISIMWTLLFVKKVIRPRLAKIDEEEAFAAAQAQSQTSGIIYPPGYRPY